MQAWTTVKNECRTIICFKSCSSSSITLRGNFRIDGSTESIIKITLSSNWAIALLSAWTEENRIRNCSENRVQLFHPMPTQYWGFDMSNTKGRETTWYSRIKQTKVIGTLINMLQPGAPEFSSMAAEWQQTEKDLKLENKALDPQCKTHVAQEHKEVFWPPHSRQ